MNTEHDPVIDGPLYRQVLGHFLTGVTVITAVSGGEPVGMAASSFTSLSMDPPLVLFCAGIASSSWPRIQQAGHYCVNVLGSTQEHVSRQFASKADDKFQGVGWRTERSGAPVLTDALAWIDCRIENEFDGGDHVIVVGRVLALGNQDSDGPLAYFRGGYGNFSR